MKLGDDYVIYLRAFSIYNAVLVLITLIPVVFFDTTTILRSTFLAMLFGLDIICWFIIIYDWKNIKKESQYGLFLSFGTFVAALNTWIEELL